ncbi:hypothetical protein Daus18300_000147 [Diaporthe australafricana]|uniref:Fungal STAND N-terminal Goodbye domain-containing protein n=1 Tax=Diaporthe australafricana TaxID=127596 RepID=A0ABR3Y8E2_9PEZI
MALAEKQTDIALLWEEALDKYNGVAKVDIRALLANKKSVSSIVMEQQHQLESFGTYRHDRGKLDKLRSFISSNADIIQGAATQVASAASAAFPPSSAILTAFTCVMTASKHVSEDYDMIESFFDVMHSFILRLSLLENKIPAQLAFQKHLIFVFSSLLSLAGLARSYCLKGRFTKWAKALVEGKDPELQGAYASLHENLRRLESAVMLQTLRTTIEVKEEAMSANQGIKALQTQSKELQFSLNINTAITEKTLSVSVETNSDVRHLVQLGHGAAEGNQELLRRSESIARTLDTMKKMQPKEREAKDRNLRSAAAKPANFERLRTQLACSAERSMFERQHDLELSSVDGIFDWIENDASFTDFTDDGSSFLQVLGAPGMGKSTMAFRMFRLLKDKYFHDPTTCVASFYFDEEHDEMKSVVNMIRWCAIKAAQKDTVYCAKVLVELQQNYNFLEDDVVWEKLITTKYGKDSDRRLILILDGIERIEEEEFAKLLKCFHEVKPHGLNIQIVLICDTSKESELSSLEPKRIDLVKSKVGRDMQRLVWHRTRTQPRLQKLRVGLRKMIIRKITKQADSFLYVEHTMRRLNSLGREGLILKELENLPSNIESLYETILAECAKNRSPGERELLRSLFAWLAYAKSNLTVGEANILIDIITKEMSISIEEELDGRLSRLLRVSGSGDKQVADDDSSENELDQVMDEDAESAVQRASDADNLLGFQERSLRAYFRRPNDSPDGLRSTPTQAHVTIFSMVSAILSRPNESELDQAKRSLTVYAAEWMFAHLLEIGADQVNDQQAAVVLESLFNILSNKNDALQPIEELTEGDGTIFTLHADLEGTLKALSTWSKRALSMPSNSISYEAINFYRPLLQEPYRVFIPIARAHINNWFAGRSNSDSFAAFRCAHFSLQQGQKLPELRQNQVLLEYFQGYEKTGVLTEQSFEVISNVFWDVAKTSAAYKGIGMAMKYESLHEAAVKQLDLGLADGSIDDVVRFGLLSTKGSTFLALSDNAEPGVEKENLLRKTLETFDLSMWGYDKLAGVDKENTTLKWDAANNYASRAKALSMTGQIDPAFRDLQSSLDLNPLGFALNMVMPDFVSACAAAHETEQVMKILQTLDPGSLARYLLNTDPDHRIAVREAAKRSGEGRALLELYNTAVKYLGNLDMSVFGDGIASLSYEAAEYSRRALGEDGMAKDCLERLINDPKSDIDWIEPCCGLLSEQLFENFRRSNNPIAKKTALEETKKLLAKLSEVHGNDFKAAKSNISLLLAWMLRKLGPALEWHDVLEAAFQSCVEDLRDDIGWNDSTSLRRLARLLMSVDGMEIQAQVAMTVQHYVIDAEVHKSDLAKEALNEQGTLKSEEQQGEQQQESAEAETQASGEVERVTTNLVSETSPASTTGAPDTSSASTADREPGPAVQRGQDDNASNSPQTTTTTPAVDPKPATTDATPPVALGGGSGGSDDGINPMNEGLRGVGRAGFWCNDCRKDVVDWTHGGAYMCLYCIDCDICEECFEKRAARHRGELEADWRVVCPQGHRHIQAPVEGWRGVKDGMLQIGGDVVSFKEWLWDVENQWKAYWDRFWTDEDALV